MYGPLKHHLLWDPQLYPAMRQALRELSYLLNVEMSAVEIGCVQNHGNGVFEGAVSKLHDADLVTSPGEGKLFFADFTHPPHRGDRRGRTVRAKLNAARIIRNDTSVGPRIDR